MRQSQLFIPTLREAPAEAEARSHQILLRSGMIRQTASGIYSLLPLGRRVLHKIEQIVREEMDAIMAQETLLPSLQPIELWEESGRNRDYGPELMRLSDRHDRSFALGPTHEEVITALIRDEVHSYRQLPLTLYQISTKYRDERRPRFGVLRGREFLMKDAYSFSANWEELDRVYEDMVQAYTRIFTRVGLHFTKVEADAGTIGGSGETHEFMALADIGEDTIVTCTSCDYAANLEKATFKTDADAGGAEPFTRVSESQKTKVHTPDTKTIPQVASYLDLEPQNIIKTLLYEADGVPVAVLIRGDHEVNEIKLQHALKVEQLEMLDQEKYKDLQLPVGYLGPYDLSMRIIADYAVISMDRAVTGANEVDHHYIQVQPGQDFTWDIAVDIRNAVEGDLCSSCGSALTFDRGIEVGHVFKLGTKYSDAMGATFLNQTGTPQKPIMGCYGIGISRLLGTIAEQYSADRKMSWPVAVAPYHVHLIPISVKDEVQMALVHELESSLTALGVEVLVDDRNERPGVKFKDADLMGLPIRVIVGRDAAERQVECSWPANSHDAENTEPSSSERMSVEEVLEITKMHIFPKAD
ncbi:proline--tRNA ligase [Paenibacillus sp. J45TS6]|uniref:proline--tRNA ligase n=1 Tax=Paenibacillus sp. J45TS6 TaxID=2807196 RepID=UPI001B219E6B|nr:proline--tRNA ligase [Paenibacillus sp. J45TS6]GIP44097.1 proline--tRNA ligase [Paenibacillus sp. J45TS6]